MAGLGTSAAATADLMEDDEPQAPTLVAEQRAPSVTVPSWMPEPEEAWRGAIILSVLVLLVWLIAWPIGMTMAATEVTGIFTVRFGYSGAVVILAITNAVLVLGAGYLLRSSLRLEATAARLGQAVQSIEPNLKAGALREDVDMLGGEIDRALGRLVDAEKQIRQQVGAIDAATETMRDGSGAVTERLAKERQALIDATKAMNSEAEAFASAIAETSAKAQEDAANLAPDLDEKVGRLEKVQSESAEQFEALREAMAESLELLRERPQEMASELREGADTLRAAQDALIAESEKLRELIDQQKARADSLGRTLAEQQARLSKRREDTRQIGGSWRRILDKVEKEKAEPTPPPQPAALSEEEKQRLDRLYAFSLVVRQGLFGDPGEEALERFMQGDRQIFIRELLSRDREDLKARLSLGIDADPEFAQDAEVFLTDFDALLGPLMDGEPEATDAALSEMLASPMGQLYVVTGTASGHFD